MSKVLKSIGKVFKKVVKGSKTILPGVLAAGAVVFTAGAALGALPTWGSAVSSVVGKLGAGEVLTNVLTGAVTQAGYGAALGAGLAGVTGGDMEKGLQMGGLAGAMTGGLTGGFGGEVDPIGEAITGNPTPMAGTAQVSQGPSIPGNAPSQTAQNVGPMGGQATGAPTSLTANMGAATTPPALPGAGVPPAATTPASKGLLGWAKDNQTIVGNVGAGLGMGAMNMAAKTDPEEAANARSQADQERIRQNYAGTGRGLLTPNSTDYIAGQPQRQTPAQRFDPRTYPGRYAYNTQSGQIEYVPNAPTA